MSGIRILSFELLTIENREIDEILLLLIKIGLHSSPSPEEWESAALIAYQD